MSRPQKQTVDSVPYAEKLKDPRWQKKRLEIMERAQWRCEVCYRGDKTLHVHHDKYGAGEPWEAQDSDLFCLCSTCHEAVHALKIKAQLLKDTYQSKDFICIEIAATEYYFKRRFSELPPFACAIGAAIEYGKIKDGI